MVIDTSVLIALLLREPDADAFSKILVDSRATLMIAVPTLLETTIVLQRIQEPALLDDLDRLVAELALELVAFGPEHLSIAREAYRRFGKGSGHPAGLNFGDCFSYGLAKFRGEPLLFKGDDFVRTDILVAGT